MNVKHSLRVKQGCTTSDDGNRSLSWYNIHIKAISCNLIVNELISNSVQHALPNSQKKETRISFAFNTVNETYRLYHQNNGVKVAEFVNFEHTKTFGISLLYRLIRQLNSMVMRIKEAGAHFFVSFSSKEIRGIQNEIST